MISKQSLRNTTSGPLANQTYTSDTDGEARSFYVSRTIHVANFRPYAVPCVTFFVFVFIVSYINFRLTRKDMQRLLVSLAKRYVAAPGLKAEN